MGANNKSGPEGNTSDNLERGIAASALEIAGMEKEVAILFGSDGTILQRAAGGPRNVQMQMQIMKGCHLLHNHPSGYAPSMKDLHEFLRMSPKGLTSLRVTGRLAESGDVWEAKIDEPRKQPLLGDRSFAKVDALRKAIEQNALDQLLERAYRNHGEGFEDAGPLASHEAIKSIAPLLGLRYTLIVIRKGGA